MATGGEARQKGVEELEKEVTCPVCHDQFQEPKILPCLHYYCKQCIQALALSVGANQPFPCPACGTDTFLPHDNPDQLPTAYLEELKEGAAKDIVVKETPPPTCKVHDKQAKIYCYDCKSLICRDCIVEDHKEHEYEFVQKAAPETKKKLMEQLTPLSEIQGGIRNAVKNVEKRKSKIGEMGGRMTSTIKQSFQKLRDILNKREKELLAETAATVEQKTARLNVQQKKLEMCSSTIQSLVEFVERSTENATDEELLTMHTQMMTRIREETEKQRQAVADLEPVEEADRAVVIECADQLKKQCQDNANFVKLPVNFTVDKIEAEVGKRSEVVLCLNFHNGQPVKEWSGMEASLTSKVDGSCKRAKVVRKKENSYQIRFTPTVRGLHQLEVIYNDTPVLGGPIEIFTTISPTQLGKPVRNIFIGRESRFVTFNSSEEMLVTAGHEVVAFDKSGKKLYSIRDKALIEPYGIAVDESNVYVTDVKSNSLLKFDKTGKLLKSFGQEGIGKGEFNRPFGITVVGDEVFVCDYCNNRLQVFTSDLEFLRQFGTLGNGKGQFAGPFDVTHDEEGNLYVTDHFNNRVQVLTTQGEFLRFLTTPGHITYPTGINVSRELVYVSQRKLNGELFVYHKNGHKVGSFRGERGDLGNWDCAIDRDGFIYICDPKECRVTVY